MTHNPTINKNMKWWVFFAVAGSLAMIFADQSALPVALPSIQRELHLTPVALQWVLNSYLLALAVFIILGGKLGDKLGHRKIFLTGMIVFIVSSIGCALSPNGTVLIISRALQGVGGALMMPSSSPLFRSVVGPHEFGKMAGLYVSFASVFLMLGPTLGGFLTAYLSWRWIFWINFPLAFVAILITIFIIHKDDPAHHGFEKGFDWLGFAVLTVFLCTLVFALMQGNELGWSSPWILGCFAIAAITIVWFIRLEQRHAVPFVDLKLFHNDSLSRCVWIITLLQMAYMTIVFWPLYLQYALLLPPQQVGILLLSAQVPMFFMAPVGGRLLDKFGPRLPVRCGAFLMLIGCVWLAMVAPMLNTFWLLPGLIIFGLGSPMLTISIMSTVVSVVDVEKRGIASGLVSAGRQVGSSISLAIVTVAMVGINHQYLTHWLSNASGALRHISLPQLDALLTNTAMPSPLALSAEQQQLAHQATIAAYSVGFSAIMLLAGIALLLIFLGAKKLPNYNVALVANQSK
jgi:EmrB/QacA subfamily drug resistance transporter